jgi:hypothetical protein
MDYERTPIYYKLPLFSTRVGNFFGKPKLVKLLQFLVNILFRIFYK